MSAAARRGSWLHGAAFVLLVAACTAPPPAGATATPPPPVALPTPRAPRSVTMHVVGPAGSVPEARVCATRTGGEEQCATTGADGKATVRLISGTYAVRATPPAGARLDEGVASVDLSEATSVIVTVEGKATIAGAIRDASRAPLADAQVCAHGATSADVKCTRTKAEGSYAVVVRPGVHKIEVTGPPGSRLLGQWARGRLGSFEADLIDTRRGDVTGVDLTLIHGVVLSGVVTAARDGAPVKDAQLCTYTLAAPLGWDCERTDKEGRYAALREPGTYWVWTIPPGDRGSRLVYQRYDRVAEGVRATPFTLEGDRKLDVALTEGTVVRGRVTASDGEPVVLALVCIDTPFPTGRICRETGDDGTYEIATRPETYVIAVYPPDASDVIAGYYPDARPDWTRADEITVGRSDLQLDIVLPRGVRFSGTVRDERGAPVEGATINVNEGALPRYFGSTDIHGRYSIAVRPGTYTVDVFPPRISPGLSVVGQPIDVSTEAGYDVVLPDASPE
ncbi:MAG: carboxypeptidase regulatory-like domain-containing protein [Chloroflexi bacterium]|nr:carboxypeptidase regulatory-like domain-containing protein [Chloroflexota bacterium]